MENVQRIRRLGVSFGSLAATLALIMPTSSALAATDGVLGAQSSGSINISASVANRVRITGLTDVSFLNQDAGIASTNSQNICVWSNTATKGYSIRATGSGAANAFTLSSGASSVGYSVQWNGASGSTTGTVLSAGATSTGYTSTATHQSCSTGVASSASLIVGIGTTDLSSMQAGLTYTGTLTLLVSPE